jgi:CBS domain-containing protein
MSSGCECIGESETVADAAAKLADLGVGAMPICGDDDKLKGMITDRDITVKVVAQGKDASQVKAGELGDGPPVTVDADADAEAVVRVMEQNQIRRVPVLEDKRLVGIVSQADVARKLDDQKTGAVVEAISAE